MSVKLHAEFTDLKGRTYRRGDDVPWLYVYPLFLVHMLVFGGLAFHQSYAGDGSNAMGGLAIALLGVPFYIVFYRAIFGREQTMWLFINAALGILGIASEIGWLLSLAGKKLNDYPTIAHIAPFTYYVMYTFLLRHAVLDLAGARDDAPRTRRIERNYVLISVLFYSGSMLIQWVL
jgi:hypothetical protein